MRRGAQSTTATGFTREFKDYRHYTPREDYRAIDWRLYARLEKLFDFGKEPVFSTWYTFYTLPNRGVLSFQDLKGRKVAIQRGFYALVELKEILRQTRTNAQVLEFPTQGEAFRALLEGRVDADGVAVRTDAVEEGVTAVAAPVRGTGGAVVGAISLLGPAFRLRGRALAAARAQVARHAAELGAEYGGAAARSVA